MPSLSCTLPKNDGTNLSNPQPSPRKQTSTINKAVPLPVDAHPRFDNKRDRLSTIDRPLSPNPAPERPLKPITTNRPTKSFLQDREHLATTLLTAIDQKVMSGKLSTATASTGGLKLIWSTKLRTAAGRAHWTRVKRPLGTEEQHDVKIELSTRIITSEEKLRDTLAHELCHCATWMIDKNPNANHGKQFKQWYPFPLTSSVG